MPNDLPLREKEAKWPPEIVEEVLQAKRAARMQKGSIFNAIVVRTNTKRLNSATPPSADEDQFVALIEHIKHIFPQFTEQLHWQMLVYDEAYEHYTTLDCLIKNGRFFFFSFDSLSYDSASIETRYIKRQFKDLKRTATPSIDLHSENIMEREQGDSACIAMRYDTLVPDKHRLLKQSDYTSCSRCAIELAFYLSKTDIFSTLATKPLRKGTELNFDPYSIDELSLREKARAENLEADIWSVWPADIIHEHPEFCKITEDFGYIHEYGDNALHAKISSKGDTLLQYTSLHARKNKEGIYKNRAIHHKQLQQLETRETWQTQLRNLPRAQSDPSVQDKPLGERLFTQILMQSTASRDEIQQLKFGTTVNAIFKLHFDNISTLKKYYKRQLTLVNLAISLKIQTCVIPVIGTPAILRGRLEHKFQIDIEHQNLLLREYEDMALPALRSKRQELLTTLQTVRENKKATKELYTKVDALAKNDEKIEQYLQTNSQHIPPAVLDKITNISAILKPS